MEKSKKLKIGYYVAGILCVLLCIVLSIRAYRSMLSPAGKAASAQLEHGSFSGVFISMFDISHYVESDFTQYAGVNIKRVDAPLKNISQIHDYLDAAYVPVNDISNVYIGLDPETLLNQSFGINKLEANMYKHLLVYATAHQDDQFKILLPYHPIDYWKKMSTSKRDKILDAYQTIIKTADTYANVTVFFPGAEEWLIANSENYLDSENMILTTEMSQYLLLNCFCDNNYSVNIINMADTTDYLCKALDAPAQNYADLSDSVMICFGDSIFANETNATGIPALVSSMTDIEYHNLAIGGTTCAEYVGISDFNTCVDTLVDPYSPDLNGNYDAARRALQLAKTNNKKLVFTINYGLNDYFDDVDLHSNEVKKSTYTYAGAMRVGIEKLKKNYPEALIIVITPNRISFLDYGKTTGGSYPYTLSNYVTAAREVAMEYSLPVIDQFFDLGIDDNNVNYYLMDEVHYNPRGRLVLAKYISQLLTEQL